jgi:tetratricopeptide (TPR) repeat protein
VVLLKNENGWRVARRIVLAMAIVGAAIRLHNVWVFPGLRAPDGFGHFTYIWFLAETGRVPLAMSGWSFFHPPLYYALVATFWKTLSAMDPYLRLKVATGFIALLGLLHVGLSWTAVRRRLPDEPLAAVVAAGLVLFVPLNLFSAGYLGNEAFGAVLCTTSLFALLAVLKRETITRAALLGGCLGLAMLVKFTALAIVAGAFATIALRALVQRNYARGLRTTIVAAVVMLTVCGAFYVRNVSVYGTPFQMSRDTLAVRRIENIQTQGRRTILEYLLFDPMIIVRPHWPRDMPIVGPLPDDYQHSSLRESIWTGIFANTWFDGVGGQILPAVTHSEESRRAGQLLLTLALLPNALILFGIWTALRDLRKDGWDDTHVAMLMSSVAVLSLFVIGTISVPMHAAVKATYLAPLAGIFGYWFGIGFSALARRVPRFVPVVLAELAVLTVVSVTVFTLDVVVDKGFLERTPSSPIWQNAYGVVAYAGGDRATAAELFDAAASGGWHLGHENVAHMAAEDGDLVSAVYHLRQAAALQKNQSFGLLEDRQKFETLAQAQYANSLAVLYDRLGWHQAALDSAHEALRLEPGFAEAHYNLAALKTRQAKSNPLSASQARVSAHRALQLDPTLAEAAALIAGMATLEGDCEEATLFRLLAQELRTEVAPAYPYESGTGDLHTAAINPRPRIAINVEQTDCDADRSSS